MSAMLGRRLLLALAAAALVGIGGLIGIAASGGNSTNTPAPAAARIPHAASA